MNDDLSAGDMFPLDILSVSPEAVDCCPEISHHSLLTDMFSEVHAPPLEDNFAFVSCVYWACSLSISDFPLFKSCRRAI